MGTLRRMDGSLRMGRFIDPAERHHWWFSSDEGGGALGAMGSHVFDVMRFVSRLKAKQVSCVSGALVDERVDHNGDTQPVTADEWSLCQLRWSSGVQGSIDASMVAVDKATRGLRITIAGSKASLVYADGVLTGYRHEHAPTIGSGASGTTEEGKESSDYKEVLVRDEWAAKKGILATPWATGTVKLGQALKTTLEWGDVRSDELKPAASFDDGAATQRFLDAAKVSAHVGRWITIAPGADGKGKASPRRG